MRRASLGAVLALALTGTAVTPVPADAAPAARLVTVTPEYDGTSLIRNPGMGWGLYVDTFEEKTPDADAYWSRMDAAGATAKASFFYLRIPWVEVEPTEGRYLWREDGNLRKLLKGAWDRGLKVAFRVYYHGGDYWAKQATPQFVFDAGTKRYLWNDVSPIPHVDDPVFQSKYGAMVSALGRDFDDPAKVAFIDGVGLGLWGENHNEEYLTPEARVQVYRWVTGAYSAAFERVLLGLQYGPNTYPYAAQEEALDKLGYVIRRDSFGCAMWFPQADKDKILSRWPADPVYAENCFHHVVSRGEPYWKQYGFDTLRQLFGAVLADAKQLHANTLDLRVAEDAEAWMREAPDMVDDFARNGGYRLAPVSATVPAEIGSTPVTLDTTWRNTGIGRLPNDTPQWNGKYRVAYALLDRATGRPVYRALSDAQPGSWLKGTDYQDRTTFAPRVSKGRYDFAVAIVDRDDRWKPGVKLALKAGTRNGWHVLGQTTVTSWTRSS